MMREYLPTYLHTYLPTYDDEAVTDLLMYLCMYV